MKRFLKIEIALAILVIMMAVFTALREPVITGLVILTEEEIFSKDVNLTFDANGNYLLEFNESVKLKSLKVTGSVFGEGKVSVLLNNQYSIYNNQDGPVGITGLVVAGVDSINNTQNETFVNDSEPIINGTQPVPEINKSISTNLNYIENNFDPDNDGITNIEDAVDFEVDISANFDYNEENLCTRFEIYSEDNEESTFVCQGNINCCNFVNLAPFSENWDDPYYSYYLKDGASFNNIISALVIHYDVAEVGTAEIVSSDTSELSAKFLQKTDFTNTCLQTCSLDLEGTSFNLNFEISDAIIKIDSISYTIETAKEVDLDAPNPVTNIKVLDNEGRIILTWDNPTDDFAGVKILRAQNDFSSQNYSEVILEEVADVTSFMNSSNMLIDTSVSPGVYYYNLYSYDSSNNFAARAGVVVEVKKVNEKPILVKDIPSVTIDPNQTASIELDSYFSDPNNDTLTYSYNPMNDILIDIQEQTAFINPVENFTGIRSTFFTANDSELSVNSNVFSISVEELDLIPPNPVTNIIVLNNSGQIILRWQNPTESDFSGVKVLRSQADFPPKTYPEIFLDLSDVTSLMNDSNTLVDTSANQGVFYYSIYSFDSNDNFAQAAQIVVEVKKVNQKPILIKDIPNLNIRKNENSTIKLSLFFSDPENDALTYSSNEIGNVSILIENDFAFIVPDENFTGNRFIFFIANDSRLTALSNTILINVTETIIGNITNQKPASLLIPAQIIQKNSEKTLNLNDYFIDPENDSLSFTVNQPDNITITISNNAAIIKPQANFTGQRFSFITANDSFNKAISNTFLINVTENVTGINITNATAANITENITQVVSVVEINKPVKWKKEIEFETAENLVVDIPEETINVTVKRKGTEEIVSKEKIKINDKGKLKDLETFETERKIELIDKEIEKLPKPEIGISSAQFELEREKQQLRSRLPIQAAAFAEDNKTEIIIEDNATSLIVEYVTEGPSSSEKEIDSGRKQITVSSNLNYENVLTYTEIQEIPQNSIKLFWYAGKEDYNNYIQNNSDNNEITKVEITNNPKFNVNFIDSNGDGLIDRLEWLTPHLSNQTFEVEITILNVQSFPVLFGNWTVNFNTTGTANLTISAYDATTFTEVFSDSESSDDDLETLELVCGSEVLYNKYDSIMANNVYYILEDDSLVKLDDVLNSSLRIKSVFVENFSCSETASHTVKVITGGKHSQEYRFGSLVSYAFNLVQGEFGGLSGGRGGGYELIAGAFGYIGDRGNDSQYNASIYAAPVTDNASASTTTALVGYRHVFGSAAGTNLTITESLNATSAKSNDHVWVAGKVNLSNGTDIPNLPITVLVNGSAANITAIITGTKHQKIENGSDDWSSGTVANTTIGSGNISLTPDSGGKYSNQSGTFTSVILDANTSALWNHISWIGEYPYGELPSNIKNEEGEGILGGVNMSGNVLLMHLNNDSSNGENNSLFYDFSGRQNNGTCSGSKCARFTAHGKISESFEFDGIDNYINVSDADSLTSTNGLTLSLWIKRNSTSRVEGLIGKYEGSNKEYFMGFSTTVLRFDIRDETAGGNIGRSMSESIFDDQEWHHVVGTWDGTASDTGIDIYVDSVVSDTSNEAGGSFTTMRNKDASLRIGAAPSWSADEFNGTIDEVAIWNRSLTASEVVNLYRRGVLKLNLSVRSCDDSACSGESFAGNLENASGHNLNTTLAPFNRYFQYRFEFNGTDINYTPTLFNVSINYTALTTDSNADYNYTFVVPSLDGTIAIEVNTTHLAEQASNSVNLEVDTNPPAISIINPANSSAEAVGTTSTIINITTNKNSECRYNNAADADYASMTVFTSTGLTNHTFTLSSLTDGTDHLLYYRCNTTAFGNVNANSTIHSFSVDYNLNISESLSAASVAASSSVWVAGKVNLSNGSNAAHVPITIQVNGSLANITDNVYQHVDTNETGFNAGNYTNSTETDSQNITLTSNDTRQELEVDANMVLYLRLNNDSSVGESNTQFFDFSNGKNNGTCVGGACPTFTADGKLNSAFDFDGTNDNLTINDDNSLDLWENGFAVSLWFKTSVSATEVLFFKGTGTGGAATRSYYCFVNTAGGVYCDLNDGTNEIALGPAATGLNDGKWHHLAFVDDNATVYKYIDGILDNSVDSSAAGDTSNANLLIIGDNNNGNFFNGLMDEFAIWNKSLTAHEVNDIYQRQKGTYFPMGNFTSQQFDAESNVNYTTISWNAEYDGIYQKELPDNAQDERTAYEHGANMTGNVLLLHLNNKSYGGIAVDDSGSNNNGTCSGNNLMIDRTEGAVIGNMTLAGGLAAAFDGTTVQDTTQGAKSQGVDAYSFVGKDWGAGVTKVVRNMTVYGTTDRGYSGASGTITLTLQASNDNFTSEIVELGSSSFSDANSLVNQINSSSQTAYRYHRVKVALSSPDSNHVAELQFSEEICDFDLDTLKFGNTSVQFDGIDDYINMSNPSSLDFGSNDFTYSAWVKTSMTATGHIIGQDDNSPNHRALRSLSTGKASFQCRDSSSNNLQASGNRTVNDGMWHHFVAVRSGAEGFIYVDGALDGNATNAATGSCDGNTYTSIGARRQNGNGDLFFNGTIDEAAIWNRSLSAAEIEDIYLRGTLKLNISTRVSGDNITWSDWQYHDNATDSTLSNISRYIQYRAEFNTTDGNYTPILNNVTINYTGTFTDASGDYNYTFIAPAYNSTFPILVNTTYQGKKANNTVNLTVDTSNPVITIINPTNASTLAALTTSATINITTDENANCRYNITDDTGYDNMTSFTSTGLTNHTFDLAVSDGNDYYLYYKCNDTIGNVNSESAFHFFTVDYNLNISETLSATVVPASSSVWVAGHVNRSNSTNVTNTEVKVFVNETEEVFNSNITDLSQTEFDQGNYTQTVTDSKNITLAFDFGTGNDGNISLAASKNLNTETIAAGRSYADGIAYRVNAPANGSSTVTRHSGSVTLSNGIAAGDELLLINLQGSPGDFSDAGNFETLRVHQISASEINFTNSIAKSYAGATAANQYVVVQRIPNYHNVTLTSSGSLTASAWEQLATTPSGAAGYYTGTVAFRAKGVVSLASGTSITVNNLGFRGGSGSDANGGVGGEAFCNTTGGGRGNYPDAGSPATDGICGGGGAGGRTTSGTGSASLGGAGGGGGASNNGNGQQGGGGGGGYGTGGEGGFGSNNGENGGINSSGDGGLGGDANTAGGGGGGGTYGSDLLDTLFYGSAGGQGGDSGTCTGGGNGGDGGGIVLIYVSNLSNSGTISANGQAGTAGSAQWCAGGGGGAGGSVKIIYGNATLGTVTIAAGAGGAAGANSRAGGDGGLGRSYNETNTDYYLTGNFTSRIFDIGRTVNWSYINWNNVTSPGINITFKTRTSEDNSTWNEWSSAIASPTGITDNAVNRYFQYLATFETNDASTTPYLLNVTVNNTGIYTDSGGNYNYTFTAPSYEGTFPIKVNTTSDGKTGSLSLDLEVDESVPTFSSLANNGSGSKNQSIVNFSVTLEDNAALSEYIWSTVNVSTANGTWQNESSLSASGTSYFTNLTKTIGVAKNVLICAKIYANDTSGNAAESSETCFTVSNSAPAFTETPSNQNANSGQLFIYLLNATDNDADTFNFTLNDTSVFSIDSSTGNITGTPLESNVGTLAYTVNVTDAAAVTSATFDITVNDATEPGWNNAVTNTTKYTNGLSVQFNVTWTDGVNLSSYRFSWNDTGTWVNATNVSISGTEYNATVNHTITAAQDTVIFWKFYANDSSDNWNETSEFNFTVVSPEAVITIINPANASTVAASTTSVTINITTDVSSSCRYNDTNDADYSVMSSFTSTGLTNHTFDFTVSDGNDYTLYYRCNTSSENVNVNSTVHTFTVDYNLNVSESLSATSVLPSTSVWAAGKVNLSNGTSLAHQPVNVFINGTKATGEKTFIDKNQTDFDKGTYNQTRTDSQNVTLDYNFGDGSDSSITISSANTIVNNYTYITSNASSGSTHINVSNAANFSVGDEILIIQMQNGSCQSTAGAQEFRKIDAISGANITLNNALTNPYYSGAQDVNSSCASQIVRVPQYINVTVNSGASIIPEAWNGYTGGIVVFRANGTVNVSGVINASERGFRGGVKDTSGPEYYAGRWASGGDKGDDGTTGSCPSNSIGGDGGDGGGTTSGGAGCLDVAAGAGTNGGTSGVVATGGGGGCGQGKGGVDFGNGGGGFEGGGGGGGRDDNSCGRHAGGGGGAKPYNYSSVEALYASSDLAEMAPGAGSSAGGGGGSGGRDGGTSPTAGKGGNITGGFSGNPGGGIILIAASSLVTQGTDNIVADGGLGGNASVGQASATSDGGGGGGGAGAHGASGGAIKIKVNDIILTSNAIKARGGKGGDGGAGGIGTTGAGGGAGGSGGSWSSGNDKGTEGNGAPTGVDGSAGGGGGGGGNSGFGGKTRIEFLTVSGSVVAASDPDGTNSTFSDYYLSGTFSSQIFDAGTFNTWNNITWTEVETAGNNVSLQVRSCDDSACSGESFVGPDATGGTNFVSSPVVLNTSMIPGNRYFQYIAHLETNDTNVTPFLENVSVYYNQSFTDADGNYNFTFIAPGYDGTFPIKVNATYGDKVGSFSQDLTIDSGAPAITIINPANASTLAAGTASVLINITTDENANCRYNDTVDKDYSNMLAFTNTGLLNHTFTLTTSDSNNYTLYYRCNDTVGNVNANSTIHSVSVDYNVNISESLSATSVAASSSVWVAGKVNLTNGTNITNSQVRIFLNETEQGLDKNFTDTSETDFNLGTYNNTVAQGTGSEANITLINHTPIVATGGTITTEGDYTVHTFTSNGTFNITSGSGNVDILIIAGGGGGGEDTCGCGAAGSGGGGGAGGVKYFYQRNISSGAHTVIVGGGGAGSTSSAARGSNGTNSSFIPNGESALTSWGGGGGGSRDGGYQSGSDGGSGGGGGQRDNSNANYGNGTANQGNRGGSGYEGANFQAGGGGGAGGVGGDAADGGIGGQGGEGITEGTSSVYDWQLDDGTNVTLRADGLGKSYAGGGGGAGDTTPGSGRAGGGDGSASQNGGTNAAANTGSGGGGNGGDGASGIVVVRYLTSPYPLFGNFTSQQFDAGISVNYTSISWNTPFADLQWKELPDNAADERATNLHGANMTGNVLLMHFNNTEQDTSDANLVSLYHFDGDANDAASINNGTINGAASTNLGKYGKGYDFDGVDDNITISDSSSLDITTDLSISVWAKLDSIKDQTFVARNVNGYIFNMYATGKFAMGKNGVDEIQSNTALSTNTWYHLVATHNSSDDKLYLNGVEDKAGNLVDYAALASPIVIGENPNSPTTAWAFNGTMDEVAIYNKSLSASEVDALFKRGISADTSGSNNNATDGRYTLQTDGRFEDGANFDGVGDFVNISDGASDIMWDNFTSELSVSAWVYSFEAESLMSGNKAIISKDPSSGGSNRFMYLVVSPTSNSFYFQVCNAAGTTCSNTAGNTSPSAYRWYHVAGTYDTTNGLKLYVDGIQEGNDSIDKPAFTTNNTFDTTIGKLGTQFWNGTIDEVAIWNRTLSAAEIEDLYLRGVLNLNISYRTSDDNLSWGDWNYVDNATESTINNVTRYIQYKAEFNTTDGNFTPILNDVAINYTGIFTDSSGDYNYTFTAPSYAGTFPIKVNTTYSGKTGSFSQDLTVDESAPTFTSLANNGSGSKNQSVVNFSVTLEDNSALSEYIWSTVNVTKANSTWQNETSLSASGTSYFTNITKTISVAKNVLVCAKIYANDTSGNAAESSETCFTVANSAPTFTETPSNQNANSGQLFIYLLNATDNDADTFNFTLNDTSVFSINSSNGNLTGHPNETEVGTLTYQVNISDGTDVTSADFDITVGDITPPTWSDQKTNVTKYVNGTIVQFNVTWTDGVNLSSYKFSWNDTGTWINVTNVSISGTSYEATVNHTITAAQDTIVSWKFYANDSSDNWNETSEFNFTVQQADPIITIINPANASTVAASTTSVTINITTDVSSSCRYNDTADADYSVMSAFTNTGLTNHTFDFTVSDGNDYTLYYRCNATDANVNANSTIHTFSVDYNVNVSESLSATSVLASTSVWVAGKVNLSNGSNLNNNQIRIFLNGTEQGLDKNFTDRNQTDFDQGNYSNTTTDSQNVTLANVTGRLNNYSIDLDGSTEILNSSSANNIGHNQQWSLSLWVNSSNMVNGNVLIDFLASDETNTNRIWMGVEGHTGKIRINTYPQGSTSIMKDFTTSQGLNETGWRNIVWTIDGNSAGDPMKVYIDGVEDTAVTKGADGTGVVGDSSRRIAVGGYGHLGTSRLNGQFDEIAFWNTTLTASDVKAVYNDGNPKNLSENYPDYSASTSLMHWWNFDDDNDIGKDIGSASTLIDIDAAAANIDTNDLNSDVPSKFAYVRQGNFTSQEFDASLNVNYTTISWNSPLANLYWKELPNNALDERATYQNGANMSGNILLLHFNESSGTLFDQSGAANDATNDGATYGASGRFGDAIRLDDVDNDSLAIPDAPEFDLDGADNGSNFTIGFWVYPNLLGGAVFQLVGPNTNDEFAMQIDPNGKIDIGYIEGATWYIGNGIFNYLGNKSDGAILNGTWSHTALVKDGNKYSFYINGWPSGNFTSTKSLQDFANGPIIGTRRHAGKMQNFSGSLDEFAIWNRSLSADEIRDIYLRGTLKLNISYKTSDDNLSWGDWNYVDNATVSTIHNVTRYIQYRAEFNTTDGNYTPILDNITINYTGVFTDSNGDYNYTFTAPSYAGTFPIKVNTTFNGKVGNNSVDLTVDAGAPTITIINPTNTSTLAAQTTSTTINITTDENANCRYNITDDTGYDNMTAFTSTGLINHTFDLTISDGNDYYLYYKCNDTVGNVNSESAFHFFSVDYNVNVSESLSATSVAASSSVWVAGKVNLSNGTAIAHQLVNIFINGTKATSEKIFIDTNETHFDSGTYANTTSQGSDRGANITLENITGPIVALNYTTATTGTNFVVPEGITKITVKSWGAAGGAGAPAVTGGGGGFAQADLVVTPGETLTVRVGGGGGINNNVSPTQLAGGGGGYSGIFRSDSALVIGAGGGGGSGNGPGGDGGGLNGDDGGFTAGFDRKGGGGTQSAGGSAGGGDATAATAGSSLTGGVGGKGDLSWGGAGGTNGGGAGGGEETGNQFGGGGGGGGYFGGGGGGSTSNVPSGGGGGSSYANGTANSTTSGNAGTAAETGDANYISPAGSAVAGNAGNDGLVVILYNTSPFLTSGSFESQIFDAGTDNTWNNVTWTEIETSGDNISFQIRSCDDSACSGESFVGPDGTTGTNFTISPIVLNASITPGNRYFQYIAHFATNNTNRTSYLENVSVYYNQSFADADGNYNYTFTAPSYPGTFPIVVNTTYSDKVGSFSQDLTVSGAPTLDNFTWDPTLPNSITDLTLNATCTNTDVGEAVNATWYIYKDDVLQADLNGTQNITSGSAETVFTLGSGNTTDDEKWLAEVWCDDGTIQTAKQNSSALTITDPMITVNITTPANQTNLSQNSLFTLNVTLNCLENDCGNVTVTLDPHQINELTGFSVQELNNLEYAKIKETLAIFKEKILQDYDKILILILSLLTLLHFYIGIKRNSAAYPQDSRGDKK